MFAIKNTKTGKWVYGTDYRRNPRHQRTSSEQALTYPFQQFAQADFNVRGCCKDYKIVEVELSEKVPRP